MLLVRALILACALYCSSSSAQSLSFSFQNVQIIQTGPNYSVQFEVHMTCDSSLTYHIGGNAYLTYNQAAFGDSLMNKGNGNYSLSTLLPLAQYTTSVVDYNLNDTTISLSWFSPSSLFGTPPSPAVYTEVPTSIPAPLAQFTFQILDHTQPIIIDFDSTRMHNLFTYMAPGPPATPARYVSPYTMSLPILIAVLPVNLSDFRGERGEDGKIHLNWQTTQEVNSDYFVIEESQDGRFFQAKSQMPAAGFSDGTLNYSFSDEQAYRGRLYYRIRSIDLDGQSSLSEVVEIAPLGEQTSWFKSYPNPARNKMYFESLSADDELEGLTIYDLSGKEMYIWEAETATYELEVELASWPNGLYLYQIQSAAGVTDTGRFHKY